MQDFRKLDIWKKSHDATLAIYRTTRHFPGDERFGLVSQLRRSSASIGANLAEGCGRGGDAEFARFVQIALGSASETDYHLLLAFDLGYFNKDTYDQLHEETTRIMRMLSGLLKKLRDSSP
jgi:four helix bundle protein